MRCAMEINKRVFKIASIRSFMLIRNKKGNDKIMFSVYNYLNDGKQPIFKECTDENNEKYKGGFLSILW